MIYCSVLPLRLKYSTGFNGAISVLAAWNISSKYIVEATSSSIVEGHWPLSLHVARQPQKDVTGP